jgi:hypothetical protein
MWANSSARGVSPRDASCNHQYDAKKKKIFFINMGHDLHNERFWKLPTEELQWYIVPGDIQGQKLAFLDPAHE